jgi:hypothetical protein
MVVFAARPGFDELERGFLYQPPHGKKCERNSSYPDGGELDQVLSSRLGFVPLVVHRQLPTLGFPTETLRRR